jgi:hypothetical protein
MTSDSPHSELLTQAAARQLLERAGQIDYESTSVDALRAAALEAGISGAAFEAALAEMRNKATVPPTAPRRSTTKRLLLGIAAVAVLLTGATLLVIPNAVERSDFANGEVYVKCLPMETAVDLSRTTLGPNSQISMPKGSRVFRISGSLEEIKRFQEAIESAEKTATSCTNTPPGR